MTIPWGDDAEDLLTGLDSAGQEASLDDLSPNAVRSLAVRGLSGDGHMVDGPPLPVSDDLSALAKKRYYQIIDDEIRSMALDALRVYHDIIHDRSGEVDWRLKKSTADSILDRALGKSPERIQLNIETKPWQKLLAGIVFDDEILERNEGKLEFKRNDESCTHEDWSGNRCKRATVAGSPMCKQHARVWQGGESPNYPGNGGSVIDGTVVD